MEKAENTLFNPKTVELPAHLVLIPQFWDKDYYEQLKKTAYGSFNLILSEFLLFETYTVISNFLGYPHLLTLLEFIKDVRGKEVYFLGTAGSLNESINSPTPLEVEAIYSSSILDYFSPEKHYPLKPLDPTQPGLLKKAAGVTVDIIQRETPSWLKEQVQRGLDFVEMEIFPLRVYLEKPFSAIVVTSDLLKETGIEIFPDKKRLQKEFIRAYELIVTRIETQN